MILRTVRGEIRCRDSDSHWAGSWCVTSYMECSARKYSRTSIISDSDISPYDTENLSDACIIRTWNCFSLQRSKQSGSYFCHSQAREETKPSFDPQFLQ